jgi:plastocyanin
MKATFCLTVSFCFLAFWGHAAIIVPGANDTDGVLNITANTEIDLSKAPTGTWNQDNTANAGKGVYDATMWAVVFKYSSVTIDPGVTVTFKNHPSRAPVAWLVSGNVTINGAVYLNGRTGSYGPSLAEPGPGGFRGGTAKFSPLTGGAGFGVGGGYRSNPGGGGSFGTAGNGNTAPAYGNPSLIPLIGGSGGAATINGPYTGDAGGGGGGAMLIACANSITLDGAISANGGDQYASYYGAGGGSGGGIRLVSSTLAGAGALTALGGTNSSAPGGRGRIRVERVVNNNTIQPIPDASIVPLNAGDTALLWPPSTAPSVKIISIGGVAAPADPRAGFGTQGADVALPQTATADIIIETTNVEQASQVQVRLTPRADADVTTLDATVASVVSTTPLVVRWTATLPVGVGYSAVQVKVVRP